MDKSEKLLKKMSKLLTMYGVSDDEKAKFLQDIQDAKYDDEEDMEEESSTEEQPMEKDEESPEPPVEEKVDEQAPVDEPTEVASEEPTGEETTETSPSETETQEPVENGVENEEPVGADTSMPPQESPETEQPLPTEQATPTEPQVDYKALYEETQKALDGVSTRLSALEQALQDAGVLVNAVQPVQEEVGVGSNDPSSSQPVDNGLNDVLKRLNR